MRRTYKPLFRRVTRPVNTADCMNEWKYFIKYNINISIIKCFKQYLPSFIQSVEFTGRVARQNKQRLIRSAHRRVAICKPGKPGFTNFSETLALFSHPISFISENEGTGQTKWPLRLTGKYWLATRLCAWLWNWLTSLFIHSFQLDSYNLTILRFETKIQTWYRV